jgi:hypothetical protein
VRTQSFFPSSLSWMLSPHRIKTTLDRTHAPGSADSNQSSKGVATRAHSVMFTSGGQPSTHSKVTKLGHTHTNPTQLSTPRDKVFSDTVQFAVPQWECHGSDSLDQSAVALQWPWKYQKFFIKGIAFVHEHPCNR